VRKGGRIDEDSSVELSDSLIGLGLERGRLKTGTPPRIKRQSVNYNKVEVSGGTAGRVSFSHPSKDLFKDKGQVPCYLTYTNSDTHKIVLDNLTESPVFSGRITERSPRSCPSLDRKIANFPDRERHPIFIEPVGQPGGPFEDWLYIQGASLAFPEKLQEKIIRSIAGLENAEFIRYGYAVVYDYFLPHQLKLSLETKKVGGLFLAGQMNGTTGYEEAAAQGLLAGWNAARKAGGQEAIVVDRAQGYMGVMVDDLVTRGVAEPYRMFTSRAEYRLSLRADNADLRLTPLGVSAGVVGSERAAAFQKRQDGIHDGLSLARSVSLTSGEAARRGLKVNQDGLRRNALDLLAMPDVGWENLISIWPELGGLPLDVVEALEAEALYAGYIARQETEIATLRREEELKLPDNLDYAAMPSLSAELRQKLQRVRPVTLGQASRIDGMTPAALGVILAQVKRGNRQSAA